MNKQKNKMVFAQEIAEGKTTPFHLGKKYIFVGEIQYFLYNFFATLAISLILLFIYWVI